MFMISCSFCELSTILECTNDVHPSSSLQTVSDLRVKQDETSCFVATAVEAVVEASMQSDVQQLKHDEWRAWLAGGTFHGAGGISSSGHLQVSRDFGGGH
jgi:hypothetical protein